MRSFEVGSWKPTEEDERRWNEENEQLLKYEIEKMRQEERGAIAAKHNGSKWRKV